TGRVRQVRADVLMVLAVAFYDVVVWVHVSAIVLAFGPTFAYPVIDAALGRADARALPAWWATRAVVGSRLIAPAGTVALLAGAYLASDRDLWSEVWVTIPAAILVVVMGLGGAFFGPNDRRLAVAAARDVEAAAGREVRWSAETEALRRRAGAVGAVAGALILVALFFMITKAGA
ncbi:MAG TPA: hypothetical protein VD931_11345, partial [Baekduia sp.]|nr:hypothetical protein [Baekduia sp.]